MQRLLSFNKEIKLNSLLSDDAGNQNFKKEDLIIVAKRKNPEILIKSFYENLKDTNKNNFTTFNSFDNIEYNKNKKNRNRYKKNKGLILSYYNENNPYIKMFNKMAYNMSENKEEDEIIKPTLKRNFFSSFDLNFNNFSYLDIYNEYEKNNESSERYKTYISDNKRKKIQINNDNFFKNNETQKNSNYSSTKDEKDYNINKGTDFPLSRPMSSSNLAKFPFF